MFLLLVSFIAGTLTILAPCILPLLPVVVGGSMTDGLINKKKALTVVLSLGASVIIFTLLLKFSTLFIDIPEYTWKIISGGIIFSLGLILIFPWLWESQMLAKLSSKSNIILGKGNQKNSFWGDVIVGSALGPVFSTCSPTYFIVLATVLPANFALGMVYLFSYTIGLCLALFMVAFVGQKIMDKLNIASDPNGRFKKIFGIIFVLVGLAIITGFDKKIETAITGAGFFDVTKIEQKLLEKNNTQDNTVPINVVENKQSIAKKETSKYLTVEQKQFKYKKVPEISTPDGFINTSGVPITLESLKGKVVLLDIWTYSCINCQRTIPYINDWYSKYKDQGLEVVGLHTPEFAFEKVKANVERAIQGFKIKYPVVLDNDYSTWQALGNQFWPRKYLVDIDGYIIYDHIGEGSYEETEKAIQGALRERAERMGVADKISADTLPPKNAISFDSSKVASPEVYFGSGRNEYLANGRKLSLGEQMLTLPPEFSFNKLYLSGTWNFSTEYAENKNAADIVFEYRAKNFYITAGSDKGVRVKIYKDDVFVKELDIKEEKLYSLIEDTDYGQHTLKIKIEQAGLKAFTFTFG